MMVCIPCALIFLFTATLVQAQDAPTLMGKRVVIKYKRPLTIGGVLVEPKEYRAYTVEKADGDWLWLTSGGIAGWIPKEEVITLDQAVGFYTQEIGQNPTAWNAYLYRGFVRDVQRDFDGAIADYSEAIRIYPSWANSYNNRGWTWHKKKEYDRAIADYKEAIRLDPKCILAIVNRGFAWQDKGEFYRAIIDFDRAIKLDPKYGRAYVARAWLYATCPDRKFRDGKLALESATKACQLSQWKDAAKLAVLAAAYAEAGDFDKAVRWQQEANDRYIDPEDKRQGRERLALFEEEKPYRIASKPESEGHRGDSTEGNRWARFPDPELAARVFSELEGKVGRVADGDRGAARKLNAAILQISRKYHLKQREVKAIWQAGHEGVSSDPP